MFCLLPCITKNRICFVSERLSGGRCMINTLGRVELDRGPASHSASSCIVLQMVPVRLAKRQPEETFFTVFIFSVLFLFSLSITPGHSLCLFLLFLFYFRPYSISPPSPSSPCHPPISILFPSVFPAGGQSL